MKYTLKKKRKNEITTRNGELSDNQQEELIEQSSQTNLRRMTGKLTYTERRVHFPKR